MTQRGIPGFFRRVSSDGPDDVLCDRTPLSALDNELPGSVARHNVSRKRARTPEIGVPAAPARAARKRHEVHALGTQGNLGAAQLKRLAMEKIGDGETISEVKMKCGSLIDVCLLDSHDSEPRRHACTSKPSRRQLLWHLARPRKHAILVHRCAWWVEVGISTAYFAIEGPN